MKYSLMFLVIFLISLSVFSLSYADFANYSGPQLQFISNAVQLLWDKPKEEVFRIMSIFPDFVCTDYEDQIGCKSKFNADRNNNIYLNFFTDDYEEKHDNLWKLSVTADVQSAEQNQDLFRILWLDGMKPQHTGNEYEFEYKEVQPLFFANEKTRMVIYFQPFEPENNPFLLAEYYPVN